MDLYNDILQKIGTIEGFIKNRNYLDISISLREYVYNNIIWGNDGLNLSNYDYYNMNANEIFDLIQKGEISFLCGGTSIYLNKIYEMFGLKSEIYNFGINGVTTHVVTLVDINNIGIIIQDASFNFTYTDKEGNILVFNELMKKIKDKKFDDIRIKKGNINSKKIAFRDDKIGNNFYEIHKEQKMLVNNNKFYEISDTGLKYYYCFGDLDFHTSYLRRNGKKISSVLDSPYELLLHPI